MKFSEALEAMLAGEAVVREGDYAHDRIFLVKGSIAVTPHSIEDSPEYTTGATSNVPLQYFEAGDENTSTRLPRFDAKDVNDNTVTGWIPTAEDMLANDWDVADNINLPFEQEFGAEEVA